MHLPKLNELATLVVRTKMFPYFDVSNYILMCCMVRDDYAISGPSSEPLSFSRKHPLSSWFSSMMLCFASVILTNFLLGESPIAPFGNHRDLLTATIVWYLINYCPFDIAYKLVKTFPVHLVVSVLKEVQRANKVHHGVHYASTLYQHSFVIICIVGVLKGAGYYYMRLLERLVRGTWTPNHHELLHPTGTTKVCLLASIIFILHHDGHLNLPHTWVYLFVVVLFIVVRVLYLTAHIENPFSPVENLACAVLFGGLFDKIKKIIIKEKPKADENSNQNKSKNE